MHVDDFFFRTHFGTQGDPGAGHRNASGRQNWLRMLRRGAGFTLLLLIVNAPPGLEARNGDDWVGGYNSAEAGLEDALDTGRRKRVYSLHNIETLRRAVRPRYVRIVNSRHYASGGGEYLEKGILFTFASYRSRKVYLSGDFNNWGLIPMRRNQMGVYYHVLPVREIELGEKIEKYRYKFQIDGIWAHDPSHPNRVDDGLGGYISEYLLDDIDVDRQISVRVLKEVEPAAERLVEFAIYLPGVENLSLVGDFNNWNPEHDLMRKGPDGIFRLRLRLRPDQYVYKYVADGKWMLDKFNEDARFHQGIGELCSYIDLK